MIVSYRRQRRGVLAAAFILTGWASAASPFMINVTFGGGLSVSQQAIFTSAADTWMGLISGYQPGITIASLNISASGADIDGQSGVLGSAGPTLYSNQAGYKVATAGEMQFDTADLDAMETNGTLLPVILHEMAHVMGLGTMWSLNSVYVDGSGEFTGINAVATYQTEFAQPLALSVPVELEGGEGTANGHWNEMAGGAGATGVVGNQGDMRYELMTGWINTPYFISKTTVASFVDIGYMAAVEEVPEPGTMALMGAGLALLAWRRARVG